MEENRKNPIIAIGVNNIGCDQSGVTFQTIVPGGTTAHEAGSNEHSDSVPEETKEELFHFIYPGILDEEAKKIHIQIKDLVKRFTFKDICFFLKGLADDKKILLPQNPRNAFEELHRMGLPSEETEGYGYDNFCKYYKKIK